MKKIPFDIKFRPEIESGKFKVQTRLGKPVRIICWNFRQANLPIIALVSLAKDAENCFSYTSKGQYYPFRKSDLDLFIII